jgi:hypothetical protein
VLKQWQRALVAHLAVRGDLAHSLLIPALAVLPQTILLLLLLPCLRPSGFQFEDADEELDFDSLGYEVLVCWGGSEVLSFG